MKDRIIEFLRAENKSSAQFAEEIGVQPSGISHILSGRNNPSLDFVLKMLEKYQFLSTEWLLFGKGTMYKDVRIQTLFDQETMNETGNTQDNKLLKEPEESTQVIAQTSQIKRTEADEQIKSGQSVTRIIWFYDDHSYDEFFPR
jgi:transcriptional regulator with XRE-family HTH domain